MPLVNFHTHITTPKDSDVIAVYAIGFDEINLIEENNYYTIGIHPWIADSPNLEKYLESYKSFLDKKQVIGIGEIGLDKLKGPDIDLQIKVFAEQVEIAQPFKKPIIIHCVKAWDELLAVKKKYNISIPWAIHGFNGSEELAKQLIEKGFYLSFGSSILKENTKASKSIKKVPINRLFLETDTAEVNIKEIYEEASQVLKISQQELEEQIYNNFSQFFNLP